MRVLFVPMAPAPITASSIITHRYITPISHIVPLLALRRLLPRSVETAFLVTAPQHRRSRKIRVLDIDHRGELHTELAAYREFKPDVVVDDYSLTTAVATATTGTPRVTLARTGIFREYVPRDHRHGHTLEIALAAADRSGLPSWQHVSDLFTAALSIITGIPSIELLPAGCRADPTYVFGGPLLLPASDRTAHGFAPEGLTRADITAFHDRHRRAKRPLVFLTAGTNWKPEALRTVVIRLLERGMAVLSTCVIDDVKTSLLELYCGARFMSMHDACARADVVVHQCGNGTYHYPLIHGVPMVTIGSGFFDRDDVAVRLEELGVSIHVPDCDDEVRVGGIVEAVVASIGRKRSAEYRRSVAPLQQEMREVGGAFNFERLLRYVAGSPAAVPTSG